LNFARSKTLDPRITFERASIGTYVDENGLIKTAAADEARFDHNPETGESLGLLVEESRTNRFSNSTTYAGTGWNLQSTNGVTTNTTDIVAPDGSLTATKWQPTTSTVQYIYAGTNGALGTSTYTMSVWVRTPTGESTTFSMNLYAPTQGPGAAAFTATDTWQRFSWTFTAQNQTTAYPVVVQQLNKILYIWGPQIEAGSFPTSYIPTSGSQVTRQPDNTYITGTNFTNFYNQSEGTLSSISSIDYLDIDNQPTAVLFNNTANFIAIGYRFGGSSSGTTGSWINYGGDQFYKSGGNILSNIPFKQSITYKINDAIACVDGTLSSSDNNVILPFPNSLYIGKSYGGYNMRRGHIRSITYYPERLTNTQLQNLTK
jgi:hypothetical protein